MNNETTNEKKETVSLFKRPWMQSLIAIVVIFGALAGFLYWQSVRNVVSIEDSFLNAPVANVSPSTSGMLTDLYVKEGDHVDANSPIALVGSETVYAKEAGIVSSAPSVIGSYFSPGESVVSIVADQKMRVEGALDETKGLDEIKTGLRATFTVDAFPGKTYEGHVDEISTASDDAGVLFSISDKRPVKKFDVYVSFDVSKYPELKTGMSAKIKVYIK